MSEDNKESSGLPGFEAGVQRAKVGHTPGPWMAAAGPSSVVGWPVVAQRGRSICNVSWQPKPAHIDEETYVAFYKEVQANGHLIAASPDLLSAGSSMLDDYQTSDQHHPDHVLVTRAAFEEMRAAIAKATGADR